MVSATHPAPLFGEGASSTLRLIVYLAAAIALMVADRRGDYLERLRQGAGVLAEPLYRLAAVPSEVARDTRQALADRSQLSEQNAELSRQLLLAQTRLRRYDALQEQNQRLQGLLDVQKSVSLSVQLAKVINVDFGPYRRHYLMLDLGSANGVQVGQSVIDAHGVLGQVTEVRPHGSTVMLITDTAHAIPVRIERTGMRTIARGGGTTDTLELPNIPVSADVKVGDKLVTSGLGGRFPPDFPVGVIRSIANDASGMFAAAKATPEAAIDRSSEVLVLHELADPIGPPALLPQSGPPASLAGDADAAKAVAARCHEAAAAMMRVRGLGWLFWGSIISCYLLQLAPLPLPLQPLKPFWLALVLIYWILELPERVPLGLAFILGVAADLLTGELIGEQALRLCILCFIVLRFSFASALLSDVAADIRGVRLVAQRPHRLPDVACVRGRPAAASRFLACTRGRHACMAMAVLAA